MELFRNSRLKIGNRILSKRAAKSRRKMLYSNFSSVKKIGIVWDASKKDDFPALARFHQKMQDKDVAVNILGYYNYKELPDQYTAIHFLTCIRNSDINIFHIPKTEEAESFIDKKFDVLIDMNSDNVFTLTYISTLSKASFKVGLPNNDSDNSPFDLIIELKKPVKAEEYLNLTLKYLEMINS